MYSAGSIIFFDPFYFKNGSQSKPKYFLVLKVIDSNAILVSLPTSQDYFPRHIEAVHGCIEVPEGCFNCYVFKSNIQITQCGFSFPLDTYLYGQWVDIYDVNMLQDNYILESIDYEIIGELTANELQGVLSCFRKSASVRNKFKRMLNQ